MSKVSSTTSKAEKRSARSGTAASSSSNAKGGLPMPIIIGVVGVLIFVAVMLFFFVGGKSKPAEQNVEVVVPQSGELNTGDAEIIEVEPSANDLMPIEPSATVATDPFSSADPINALTEEAVTTAIKSDPSYTENVGLLMPDGTMFTENTPDFNALKQEIGAPVHSDLTAMIVSQDSSTGPVWVFNDISSGEGPIPLASQDAKAKATRFAIQSASGHLQTVKQRYSQPVAAVNANAAQGQAAAPVEPVQRVVEISTINDEERQLLTSIVQELRTQNKANQMELESVIADKKKTERELVQLRQRVENNPALKTAVQATMLPESSGYKLEAVMGDKIFLRNTKTGESTVIQQGHRIPSTNLNILSAELDSGLVFVTPAK